MREPDRSVSGPRSEWDAFVSRLADAVQSAHHPEGASHKVLAECTGSMAPMTRLLAQALFIRLEKNAAGGFVSLALLEQHAPLSSQALRMLVAFRAESHEPRVHALLARVASGTVRSDSAIAGIAQEMGVSVPCLSRLVRRQTLVSIQRHIDVWRLLDAARLLSKTFLSVEEIAAIVGYGHTLHLDRCFWRYLRVRPTDLRSYSLKETCRAYMRGRHDTLFANWVSHRLPMIVAQGERAERASRTGIGSLNPVPMRNWLITVSPRNSVLETKERVDVVLREQRVRKQRDVPKHLGSS